MVLKPAATIATCLTILGCASSTDVASQPADSSITESSLDGPNQPEDARPPTTIDSVTISSQATRSTEPPITITTSTTTDHTSSTTTSTTSTTTAAPTVFDVVIEDGEFVDDDRARRIPYRMYAPVGADGDVPVALVSHGGQGSDRAYLSGEHLGTTFAAGGFLAIHIGHVASDVAGMHRLDRPADVTAVLDRLETGALRLPDAFTATAVADTTRVGHTGHSFGAYTAHAVGGATFDRSFTDDRIDAIAPISPQGADQFGAFDDGPGDTTWSSVTIPAYNLIGVDEVDTNAIGTIDEPGWRLTPFENYPGASDTFLAVIEGQNHSDMWRTGTATVDAFVATEILAFFDVYVAGDSTVDACLLGTAPLDVGYRSDRRAAADGPLTACTG